MDVSQVENVSTRDTFHLIRALARPVEMPAPAEPCRSIRVGESELQFCFPDYPQAASIKRAVYSKIN